MIENFQLLLNVTVYFLNFSAIICFMFVITTNFGYFDMIQHIFSNWSLGFINDIQTVNKTKSEALGSCPQGYDYLFKFNFPGTKIGCNCLNVYNMTGYTEFENKLVPGSCSAILIKLGCLSVADLPSKTLHSLWDTYYCAKRTQFDYLQSYAESVFEGSCPADFKSCGAVDSLQNILCVKEKEDCPFTTFPISHISPISPTYTTSNTNAMPYLDLSNKPDTYSTLRNFSQHFVQFSFSQGNVCIDNEELNSYSEDVYELFNARKSMKCNTQLSDRSRKYKYDFRYEPLIATNTDAFFYQEEFLKVNILALPKFSADYFNIPVVLYGRNYIGWNRKCLDFILEFKSMYLLASNIEQFSIFYLVYSLVMLIYVMLFIMILKELLHEQYPLKILIILISIVMTCFILFLVFSDYLKISRAIELCFTIIKKRCSDEETNRLILFALEIFEEISKLFLVNILFYIIMILLSIVKILLTCYKMYKRRILNRLIQGNVNEFEMMLLM